MERFICIHGHFYQPPRENPWLEAIELQDSAYPFHDWNERISAECYAPNGASRVLSPRGRIERIRNNYARISYNFGPTLLAWLEEFDAESYERVLAADKESLELFAGHGSALAQGYNHLILPLANSRDKRSQVVWGIRDFQRRFERRPEGMWLPETAVDLESLDLMAEHGILFTILAPRQASRVRPFGGDEGSWRDVSGARIDTTRPYLQRLPSGRTITLFFYNGPISQAVAFEGLLQRGELLAERLLNALDERRDWPQLVHVATDGETYGHHHRHGDMALAYALQQIEADSRGSLTNYGAYLERFPAQLEAEIFELSSWSCVHGVERWRADCGCNSGAHPDWNQTWRRPLRAALDWLRDEVAPLYEQAAGALGLDPWAARDGYIDVILNREAENVASWFEVQADRHLSRRETRRGLGLLELQRHALLMYTSCGWFFDDLSGIETTQVVMYGARVLQLARELLGADLRKPFLERLAEAQSNIPELGDGASIFAKFVEPAMLDLPKVAAHYAISSVFEDYTEKTKVYAYEVERSDYHRVETGEAKAGAGQLLVRSRITGEEEHLAFGLLHFGDHSLSCGIKRFRRGRDYERMVEETWTSFEQGDLPQALRVLDSHFGELTYSLRSLFKDEQRKILDIIMKATLAEAEAAYRQLYDHHNPFLVFLDSLGIPAPRSFRAAAELVLNSDLREALSSEEPDPDRVRVLLQATNRRDVRLDVDDLAFAVRTSLQALADAFLEDPDDPERLSRLSRGLEAANLLPFEVDLWAVQNSFYRVLEERHRTVAVANDSGDGQTPEWTTRFLVVAELLWIETPS